MPESPSLTVCVCTHDRPAYLRDCLAGLRRQDVKASRFEVLVVDSASGPAAAADAARLAGGLANGRLLRIDRPGVSLARNVGARCASAEYIAYLDDDAIPEPDWVRSILQAIRNAERKPAVIGGRILPLWEQPLPAWWPASLRGVLSIIEAEQAGEYRTAAVPCGLEPYAANMVVNVPTLLEAGGFHDQVGRYGGALLSDEEVQLAWRLQDAGHSAVFDPSIVVRHQIQAARLRPEWLLSRLYWQGVSTVITRRLLGYRAAVWRELPRRLAVAVLFAPVALVPAESARLIGLRWRLAYAAGFLLAAFGWRAAATAARRASAPLRPAAQIAM